MRIKVKEFVELYRKTEYSDGSKFKIINQDVNPKYFNDIVEVPTDVDITKIVSSNIYEAYVEHFMMNADDNEIEICINLSTDINRYPNKPINTNTINNKED